MMVGALAEEKTKAFRFSCEDDRGPGLLGVGNWPSLSPISWLDGSARARLGEKDTWGAGEEWDWELLLEWSAGRGSIPGSRCGCAAAAVGAVAVASACDCFLVARFMLPGLRLNPRMSLLVESLALSEAESETSDSVRDQRLWQEKRGTFWALEMLLNGVDAEFVEEVVVVDVAAVRVEARSECGAGKGGRGHSWVE